MIPGWLRGLLLGALLLVVVVDLGSPLVVRVQLDATAGDAAAAGGRSWARAHDIQLAEAAAQEQAVAGGATLERFGVLPDGRIAMTLGRKADSRLFGGVTQLASWYDVRVDVTSSGTTL